jgi:hypothetical protein
MGGSENEVPAVGARNDVKIPLIGAVWRVDLKRTVSEMVTSIGSKSLYLTEGLLSFFQGWNERLA